MHVIHRSASSPTLLGGISTVRSNAPHKFPSLPDVKRSACLLSGIHNEHRRMSSCRSLASSLDADDRAALGLGSTDSLAAGDLRDDTPSPRTRQYLDECHALPPVPRERAVWLDDNDRLQPVPEGSAEFLLVRRYRLDATSAARTAMALRRGGFHVPGDGVSTLGEVSDALARLGGRALQRALPPEVCAATAEAVACSISQPGGDIDPWHQFELDLHRNPYRLNGKPETSLQAFQRATHALPPIQQRFACELHQGLLAPLETCIFFGNLLHPGGALLRSEDGSGPAAARADTRFHLTICESGTDPARVTLVVEHARPLSSALPRTAGLDALPDQPTLATGSAYRVTLRAECSRSGAVTVRGHHEVLLRYPEPTQKTNAVRLHAPPADGIDARIHGQLTASIMDLHALAMRRQPDAVALHLAGIDPESGETRVAGLLVLARALDDQLPGGDVLPPDLARFAFAELRRYAGSARGQKQLDRLALLRNAVGGTGEGGATLAQQLPALGHWQHARQEFCSLLEVLFYRSAEESAIPALDVPPTRGERRERDRQLAGLIQTAKAGQWNELAALLPTERFGMWRTTRVQRPAACDHHHGSAGRYLEIALGCLNALGEQVTRA